jgi:hypothetical protein
MATQRPSLVRRTLVQIDLAFWCLHEDPLRVISLGLPTLLASGLLAVVITIVARTWVLPDFWNFVLYGVVYPWFAALIVTLAPLPAAVFAWHRAADQILTPGQCFQWCARRSSRLARAGFALAGVYLLGFVLFGLPLLIYWPRTCLAPMVALFEEEQRIFRRSRRLLRQETAVYVLSTLYFCFLIVLGVLLFLPRILLAAKLFETSWSRVAQDYLWVFEVLIGGVLLSAMTLSWCISLTLLYREIRQVREGEELREKLRRLHQQFLRNKAIPSVENVQQP